MNHYINNLALFYVFWFQIITALVGNDRKNYSVFSVILHIMSDKKSGFLVLTPSILCKHIFAKELSHFAPPLHHLPPSG
jgi:hypothetical protein